MPAKNVIKHYDAPAYYHVYNRGAAGRQLFFNDHDREKFLSLLERHIVGPADGSTEMYRQYDVEVVAYCLMGNHFHLLLFQEHDPTQIAGLMRSVSTAYAMYFNRRHRSRGHLFQEVYRASPVSDDAYLTHISRYIHLNPAKYLTYQWSSLPEYLAARQTEWVSPDRVLDMTPEQYRSFLEDYSDRLELLKSFDDELAF
ncbi:transposase [Candidatus Saccharibacteria bacterium]|nr:transposase [Candidatus Saccharibacteria bacterium]